MMRVVHAMFGDQYVDGQVIELATQQHVVLPLDKPQILVANRVPLALMIPQVLNVSTIGLLGAIQNQVLMKVIFVAPFMPQVGPHE
jgi:hypothetical protein